jgi:hypothetical protein
MGWIILWGLVGSLLMGLFSKYVSGDVAGAIWDQREQFMDEGRPRPQTLTATVLFTDIRDFTRMSENMEARDVMDWLNEYLGAMVKQVTANKGIVDKYVGDAVMAVFGIPVPRKGEKAFAEDAVNAVRCALNMGRELDRLNGIWSNQGRPTAMMRVNPSSALEKKLENAKETDFPAIYAKEGVWYEALSSLSGLIRKNPENKGLYRQRASLLEQVGLKREADLDRKAAGGIGVQP